MAEIQVHGQVNGMESDDGPSGTEVPQKGPFMAQAKYV